MAITAFPLTPVAPTHGLGIVTSGTALLNSANIGRSSLVRAEDSGTIDRIVFQVASVTTSQPIRVSIQTVSSGLPSGTVVGASEDLASVSVGYNEVTLSTPATVTAGTWYAVVVKWVSTTGTIALNSSTPFPQSAMRAANQASSTVWTSITAAYQITARYTSGAYLKNAPSMVVANTSAYASNSTPNEYALKWTPSVAWRLAGAYAHIAFATTPLQVVVYDSGGTQVAISSESRGGGAAPYGFLFDSPVTLTAGSTYYIDIKPTTTTAVTLSRLTFRDTDSLAASPFAGAILSTRTSGGAWTDTTTDQPQIIPIVSGIDVASGGSGGVGNLIGSGLIGRAF